MVAAGGNSAIPIVVVTLFWIGIGGVIPWFVKGQNKSTIRTMIVLTAVCCWLLWLITYMSQLNPLIGPELEKDAFQTMKHEWQ